MLLDIPVSHKNLVKDISDKKGFVKVRFTENILHIRFTENILHNLIVKGNWKVEKEEYIKYLPLLFEDGYIRPYFLKEAIRRILIMNNCTRNMLQVLLSGSIGKNVNLVIRRPKLTKATAESSVDIYVDKNYVCNWAWDVSTVFRLNWWPGIAREWVFRKRNWPNKIFVNEFTKTAYLITNRLLNQILKKM